MTNINFGPGFAQPSIGAGGGGSGSSISLRDQIAIAALNGMISGFMSRGEKAVFNLDKNDHVHAAKMAYRIADAMLEERLK